MAKWREVPNTNRGYGARIERVSEGELTSEQRLDLRETLGGMGFQLNSFETDRPVNQSRRNFLKAGAAALVVGGAARYGLDLLESEEQVSGVKEGETVLVETEILDGVEEGDEAREPDAFALEVMERLQHIDPEDVRRTMVLAKRSAPGTNGLSRLEYLKRAFRLRSEPDKERKRPGVPRRLEEELRSWVPGWIAQESRFREGAKSGSNAIGYWQIKDWVYKGYRGTDEVSTLASDQAAVSNELSSDNYHYILHFAGKETLDTLRSKFESTGRFLKDLMKPLMVMALNAGGPAVGKTLKQFVELNPAIDNLRGKEIFVKYKEFARPILGNEASDYVGLVKAWNEAIKREQVSEDARLAER